MADLMRARDPDDIRALMRARDLTHRELAKLADCPLGTTSVIVAGKPTSRDVAKRVARTLRRPVDVLFVDVVSSTEQSSDKQPAA